VQRVSEASVTAEERVAGSIGPGLLVYVGVGSEDGPTDVKLIADKIAGLRIFRDEAGKMNLSVTEVGGDLLVISSFALQGDARRGRRPSFEPAAAHGPAEELYEEVCHQLAKTGLTVARGVFGAHMGVASINDGPVTILLDSKRTF